MIPRKLKSRRPIAWLSALALVLFVGIQVVESGHVHTHGVDAPECIKCQQDTSEAQLAAASAAAVPAPVLLKTGTASPQLQPCCDTAHPARGPPSLSS